MNHFTKNHPLSLAVVMTNGLMVRSISPVSLHHFHLQPPFLSVLTYDPPIPPSLRSGDGASNFLPFAQLVAYAPPFMAKPDLFITQTQRNVMSQAIIAFTTGTSNPTWPLTHFFPFVVCLSIYLSVYLPIYRLCFPVLRASA
jgi:hypothetical protein